MAVKAKLLLMGLMLVIAATFAYARRMPWHWLVCTALGFSWLGDALLSRYPPIAGRLKDTFVPGMGMFAAAQICYIILLNMAMRAMPTLHMPKPGYPLGADVIGTVLPIYWLAVTLFWLMMILRTDKPKDLKIAALVYGLLLSTMGAYALAAAFTGTGIVWVLPLGGLLFMISDGIIALRIFQGTFQRDTVYEIAVWGTYVPAQLCLLFGVSALV